jgi:hypothetical protein
MFMFWVAAHLVGPRVDQEPENTVGRSTTQEQEIRQRLPAPAYCSCPVLCLLTYSSARLPSPLLTRLPRTS